MYIYIIIAICYTKYNIYGAFSTPRKDVNTSGEDVSTSRVCSGAYTRRELVKVI